MEPSTTPRMLQPESTILNKTEENYSKAEYIDDVNKETYSCLSHFIMDVPSESNLTESTVRKHSLALSDSPIDNWFTIDQTQMDIPEYPSDKMRDGYEINEDIQCCTRDHRLDSFSFEENNTQPDLKHLIEESEMRYTSQAKAHIIVETCSSIPSIVQAFTNQKREACANKKHNKKYIKKQVKKQVQTKADSHTKASCLKALPTKKKNYFDCLISKEQRTEKVSKYKRDC
jgi:hypothetical protein